MGIDASFETINKIRNLYERPGTPGEKFAALAALQRFAVEETLPRFQNIVAGKFTAYFMAKPHATMKERPAYDNLLAKQSRSCSCPLTPSGPNFIAGGLCLLRW